jgi:hypothetical protein
MPGLSGRELAERARDFVSGCVFCRYRVESGGRVTEDHFRNPISAKSWRIRLGFATD